MNDETEPQVSEVIRCPRCNSIDWGCWDERNYDCWNSQGEHVGTKVVGFLYCKACNERWTDVSIDPCEDDDDCSCEDD